MKIITKFHTNALLFCNYYLYLLQNWYSSLPYPMYGSVATLGKAHKYKSLFANEFHRLHNHLYCIWKYFPYCNWTAFFFSISLSFGLCFVYFKIIMSDENEAIFFIILCKKMFFHSVITSIMYTVDAILNRFVSSFFLECAYKRFCLHLHIFFCLTKIHHLLWYILSK